MSGIGYLLLLAVACCGPLIYAVTQRPRLWFIGALVVGTLAGAVAGAADALALAGGPGVVTDPGAGFFLCFIVGAPIGALYGAWVGVAAASLVVGPSCRRLSALCGLALGAAAGIPLLLRVPQEYYEAADRVVLAGVIGAAASMGAIVGGVGGILAQRWRRRWWPVPVVLAVGAMAMALLVAQPRRGQLAWHCSPVQVLATKGDRPGILYKLQDTHWRASSAAARAYASLAPAEAMVHPNALVRREALPIMAGRAAGGDVDAQHCLFQATGDPDAGAREQSLRLLSGPAGRGRAIQVTAALAKALSDSDRSTRVAAASILGKRKDPRALAVLKRELAEPQPSSAHADVVEALRVLAAAGHDDALAALTGSLQQRESAAVIRALGQMGARQTVRDLLQIMVQTESANTADEVIAALAKIGGREMVPALQDLQHSDTPFVRARAGRLLERLNAGRTTPAAALAGSSRPISPSAGPREDLRAVVPAEDRARSAIARARKGDRTAARDLVAALDVRGDLRKQVLRELQNVVGPSEVPELAKRVSSADWWVRQSAVDLLGQAGGKEAEAALRAALVYRGDSSVRERAATGLARVAGARAVPALIEALKDWDYTVRRAAARALGELRDRRAVGPLIAVIPDDVVRASVVALEALGAIGDAKAVPALAKALDDRRSTVSDHGGQTLRVDDAARRALERMGTPEAKAALEKHDAAP